MWVFNNKHVFAGAAFAALTLQAIPGVAGIVDCNLTRSNLQWSAATATIQAPGISQACDWRGRSPIWYTSSAFGLLYARLCDFLGQCCASTYGTLVQSTPGSDAAYNWTACTY